MFSHPAMRTLAPLRPAPLLLAPLLLAPLLLAGCGAGSERTDPDGTWVGQLQPAAGRCPSTGASDLVVSDKRITFVPGDGVISLTGPRDPDHPDALHAQFLGRDMNHKLLPLVFDGSFADGAITGTFGTPSCRATITMHRPTHTATQRLLGD